MDGRILQSAWPGESHDWLLKAALLPEAQALEAWRAWSSTVLSYDLPRGELRLLALLAGRMQALKIDPALEPQLLAIRDQLRARSRATLDAALPLLASLAQANVPLLLLKGSARHALDPAVERPLKDIDVLVPVERSAEAVDLALAEGWRLEGRQPILRNRDPIAGAHAWSLHRDGSEVDLHHFSNNLNRLVGDDDALWARALPAALHGVPVRVPAPEDRLLLSLVHGARYGPDRVSEWAVDACDVIDDGRIDWRLFTQEARRRRIHAPLYAGLVYLRDQLGRAAPSDVFAALEPAEPFVTELASYAAETVPTGPAHVDAARRAGFKRALEAASRLGYPPRRGPTAARTVFGGVVPWTDGQTRHHGGVPVPAGLHPTERVVLEFRLEFDGAPATTAGVLVRAPDLPLLQFETAAGGEQTSVSVRLEIPAVFLLLRDSRSFLVDVEALPPAAGQRPLREVEIAVRTVPAEAMPSAGGATPDPP